MSNRPPRGRRSPAPPAPRRPEVLAPAGDADSLRAALQAGADAVYFGLQEGFNARARARNFASESLEATVATIHRAGARAYLTLNTLVFEAELAAAAAAIQRAARAGVDALLVQDPAVALLAREIAPSLPLHASTQMTIGSPAAAAFAKELGAVRVVLPRELSVDEIGRFIAGSDLEVEVFVHGALCVSYSGQCLTSEAWGGRSANRGQCAQSCRLPYDLVLDGAVQALGDVKYLLSPKDLAGLRALPRLIELGVHGLKIEGRQKGAQYVATATAGYKRWVEAVVTGQAAQPTAQQQLRADLQDMALSFSRGLSDGFLAGSDHQSLVEGRFPKHRGVCLGTVVRVMDDAVVVERDPQGRPWTGALAADPAHRSAQRAAGPSGGVSAPLVGPAGAPARESLEPSGVEVRAGMGVVFDAGHPEDKQEPGGPVFAVRRDGEQWTLRFGRPGPDLRRVAVGHRVWITSDPALARATERALAAPEPTGRVPLALRVEGRQGQPLRVTAWVERHELAGDDAMPQPHASCESAVAAERARAGGLTVELLREKLAAFGGTPFCVASLDVQQLEPYLHLPVSELKAMRRRLVDALLPQVETGPVAHAAQVPVFDADRAVESVRKRVVRQAVAAATTYCAPADVVAVVAPLLLPLCRSDDQLEAAIDVGLGEVELDWMELTGLARAVARARAAGLRVDLATLRVQKPGEESFDQKLMRLAPDGLLVRHWGGLVHGAASGASAAVGASPCLHGDFSLNVTNSITAAWLLAHGLQTLTASHDLDQDQLFALLEHADPGRFTVVLHHRIAAFHTEHCVYAHLLSNGRDYHSCGRPCEAHQIALRDVQHRDHPVIVDAACRNTVFNGVLQSAAALVPALLQRGVRRFRVEFVREDRAQAARVLTAYQQLLAGRIAPEQVLASTGARAQQGVAERPMELLL